MHYTFFPVQTNPTVCFGASPGARIMPPTSRQMGNLFSAYFACLPPSNRAPLGIRHSALCFLPNCNWRLCQLQRGARNLQPTMLHVRRIGNEFLLL